MMSFSEGGQVQILSLKQQLVPHFNLLDHQVQIEIINMLDILLAQPTRKQLQQMLRAGVLQQTPLFRAHLWKLMLQSLPMNPALWVSTKQHNHELYRTLTDKFMGRYMDQQDLLGLSSQLDINLWNEIELDTRRTHSSFHFFQKQIEHTRIYLNKPTKNSDILSRILYIWGKVNPTVRYVQGMNEILAPLYYLQSQGGSYKAQSQVFFMFSALMTFLIDMHIKDMDESEQGIMGRMRLLNHFLKVVDYQLWLKLQREKILPQYYSFRWLALLLAQQFGLYETIKLWDVMLSFQGYRRYFYLYCCCVAILKYRRDTIMDNDFINILPLIQKLRDVNVSRIIEIANRLYDKYSKVNVQKIYQQMNQQLERKKEQQTQLGDSDKKKWSYTQVLQKTGNFFAKFAINKK